MSLYIVWIASKDLKDGEPYAEQPLRTAHDEVHNAFMTPLLIRVRERARHLSWGMAPNSAGQAFA